MMNEARIASKANGREICGLILSNSYFLELVQVRNKIKRGGGFAFYFSEVRAIRKFAELCKHEIVGTFHSHPVGLPQPGRADLYTAVDDSMMLIFDVIGGTEKLWHVKNRTAKQLQFSRI
jgi:proteasome lid subunit RPN8/RPN11